MSLAQIHEIPPRNLILLVGPPGSGKSTFCCQAVLNNIEMRPVIYVTTESGPSKVLDSLDEAGLGDVLPHPLGFVDAFHETVGLHTAKKSNAVDASCQDLTSLSIAISKMQEMMGENALLVFDSLTSPYMFNGPEILRFLRLTMSRLAAEGNAILACVDEGCGTEEDLISMMSAADGIVKIELMDGSKTFNVMKHPQLKPARIEVPMTWSPTISYNIDWKMHTQHMEMSMGLTTEPLREEVGDYVNILWTNFARWSCMLWDPKRFPTMVYDSMKRLEGGNEMTWKSFFKAMPWRVRLFLKFMPNNFSKVKDMRKFISLGQHSMEIDRSGIMEYLAEPSKTDEHHIRVYESDTCWGFENVGVNLGLGDLGMMPGFLQGFEKFRGGPDREWNVIETKCIGLGDPYCEIKVVPGEIDGLKERLESVDSVTTEEKIHGLLMERIIGFMLHGRPLWKERPRLGNEISLHEFSHIVVLPAFTSERYQIALRLGGAISGKRVGEKIMGAGMKEDEAVRRLFNLLEYCKVGKVSMGETLRIKENCENFTTKAEEPSCSFTTGFLNGFFSTVENQHVRETKCIAMGDPYCEWEFK